MAQRPGRKRLSIDIPIKLHDALSQVAQHRKITLTRYVIRALLRYSLHETKYEDHHELFNEFK